MERIASFLLAQMGSAQSFRFSDAAMNLHKQHVADTVGGFIQERIDLRVQRIQERGLDPYYRVR